jgi:RNA polymerase sigma-70 factor (ECF subfamily)
MGNSPKTRSSLLLRLRDRRDAEAWSRFVLIYAPIIEEFLRKRGLQDADARDLTQDVLAAVAAAIGDFEYSSEKGSFRSWLFTITANRLRNFFRDARHRVQGSGDTAVRQLLEEQPDPYDGVADWDAIYEQRMFQRAAELVRRRFRETTWRAFWQTAIEARPAKDVAAELGLTQAAVYLAKGRVIARMKKQVELLADDES